MGTPANRNCTVEILETLLLFFAKYCHGNAAGILLSCNDPVGCLRSVQFVVVVFTQRKSNKNVVVLFVCLFKKKNRSVAQKRLGSAGVQEEVRSLDCRAELRLRLTCLMTSVPSLEGVAARSLSRSSTSMVLADSVSPLLILL